MSKRKKNSKLLKMKRRNRFQRFNDASRGKVNTGPTEGSVNASRCNADTSQPSAEYEEISSAVARNMFAVLWQGDFRQGVQNIHVQHVRDDGIKRFSLLICGNKYMWMKEHYPTRTRHFSIVYGSLQRAKNAMISGTICFYQEAMMDPVG